MQQKTISLSAAQSAVRLNLGARRLQELLADSSPDPKEIAELATQIRLDAGIVREWAFQAA